VVEAVVPSGTPVALQEFDADREQGIVRNTCYLTKIEYLDDGIRVGNDEIAVGNEGRSVERVAHPLDSCSLSGTTGLVLHDNRLVSRRRDRDVEPRSKGLVHPEVRAGRIPKPRVQPRETLVLRGMRDYLGCTGNG